MEFKKKTIIWEDNNEPPKNYIWVKSDGNAYEFNHTTRQWEKIMSSNGSGSGSNSDIFFSPLAIQPSYYMEENDEANPTIYEIQDIANTISTGYSEGQSVMLFYSKEQVINLGISENILNNLQQVTYTEFLEDLEFGANKCHRDDENLDNITYNNYIITEAYLEPYSIRCERFAPMDRTETAIYKFGDDMYYFTNVNAGSSPIGPMG